MTARCCPVSVLAYWSTWRGCLIRGDPRGVRHTLTSLLLAAVAAVLAGARPFTAIGEWVADAPPHVLACLGIRHDRLTRRFEPPDEATIRRVLETIDAAALDTAVGSWLAPAAGR